MKRNIFFGLFVVLAVLGGSIFFGCNYEPLEDGIGTIILRNNSSNVIISYWAVERNGKTVGETRTPIFPGHSASAALSTGYYKIYLEDDVFGDSWLTKTTHTVRKDGTVEIKFPGDFNVSN